MKVEGMADREIQLFEDTDGEVLMNDPDRVPIFAEKFPGCAEDDPLAVIYGSKAPSSTLAAMKKTIRARESFSE